MLRVEEAEGKKAGYDGKAVEMSEEAGEMLHIVLKAYKHATFVGFGVDFVYTVEVLTEASLIWPFP